MLWKASLKIVSGSFNLYKYAAFFDVNKKEKNRRLYPKFTLDRRLIVGMYNKEDSSFTQNPYFEQELSEEADKLFMKRKAWWQEDYDKVNPAPPRGDSTALTK